MCKQFARRNDQSTKVQSLESFSQLSNPCIPSACNLPLISRDLPIAVVTALLTIASVYTLTNVAYFSALSPTELLESPAVALVSTFSVH